eukprot:6387315-Prymnesium_polylepis.1
MLEFPATAVVCAWRCAAVLHARGGTAARTSRCRAGAACAAGGGCGGVAAARVRGGRRRRA